MVEAVFLSVYSRLGNSGACNGNLELHQRVFRNVGTRDFNRVEVFEGRHFIVSVGSDSSTFVFLCHFAVDKHLNLYRFSRSVQTIRNSVVFSGRFHLDVVSVSVAGLKCRKWLRNRECVLCSYLTRNVLVDCSSVFVYLLYRNRVLVRSGGRFREFVFVSCNHLVCCAVHNLETVNVVCSARLECEQSSVESDSIATSGKVCRSDLCQAVKESLRACRTHKNVVGFRIVVGRLNMSVGSASDASSDSF